MRCYPGNATLKLKQPGNRTRKGVIPRVVCQIVEQNIKDRNELGQFNELSNGFRNPQLEKNRRFNI